MEPFVELVNLRLGGLVESSLHCCHASFVVSAPVAILIVGQPFLDENVDGIICFWDTVDFDIVADGVVFGANHNFRDLDALDEEILECHA